MQTGWSTFTLSLLSNETKKTFRGPQTFIMQTFLFFGCTTDADRSNLQSRAFLLPSDFVQDPCSLLFCSLLFCSLVFSFYFVLLFFFFSVLFRCILYLMSKRASGTSVTYSTINPRMAKKEIIKRKKKFVQIACVRLRSQTREW